MTGRVLRAIAGYYYVEAADDLEKIIECTGRGRLKRNQETILVGDLVEYEEFGKQGVITQRLPRKNVLKRPYIANVDLLVLVFAHQKPDPNDLLLAKFLVLAEASGIPYLIVFNKTDLVEKGKAISLANNYLEYGYQVLCTSGHTHLGKLSLQEFLSKKITVFAGPSGVGKSALLNMISPGFQLKTGELSEKIGRGRHTTREVQLMRVEDSYLADTPGFTQIDLNFLDPTQISNLFSDFSNYGENCHFNTCLHWNEPDCGVKLAVKNGQLRLERYQSYLDILQEVKHNWEKQYR